jgi:prevent-host-death family protein
MGAHQGSSIGIRQLKAELSQQLRRVAAGETISVTDRGKVIATISPAPMASDPPGIQWAREIVAAGAASWSGGKPRGSNPPAKRRRRALVSDAVIEDRR